MSKKRLRRSLIYVMSGMVAFTGVTGIVLSKNELVVDASGIETNTVGGIAVVGAGNASILLNGNLGQSLIGKKFNVYKLFDAENSVDGESINYTVNPEYEQALKNIVAAGRSAEGKNTTPDQVTEYMIIDYIQSLNKNQIEGAHVDQKLEGSYSAYRKFVEELRDEMVRLNCKADVINVNTTKPDNSIEITGLAYGYYVLDEITAIGNTHSASSLCMINTANPNATVNVKSDYPSLIKKIKEDDKEEYPSITDKNGWNDIADYEIGQTVPYRFTSNIPNMNGYATYFYAWHDKMDQALTFNKETVKIEIIGLDVAGHDKTYTLRPEEFIINTAPGNGETFEIDVQDIKKIVDREFQRFNKDGENEYGQNVVLTYNATLNENAALNTGRPGFENDVRLEFSNDPDSAGAGITGFTPWDTVVCFTYKLNVLKTNDHDKVLKDAKFRLYSDKDCKNEVFVKEGNNGYIVINRDHTGGTDHVGGTAPVDAVEMQSEADGSFVIHGLDSGVYYLKETKAPAGYRLLKDPIELTLKATYTNDRDSYLKGEGATDKTLENLESFAHVKTFYNQIFDEKDQTLNTEVTEGEVNITIVNKVGKKLPVTGTSSTIIVVMSGAALMIYSFTRKKYKN